MPEPRDPNRGPSAAELLHRRAAEEAARAEAMNVMAQWNAALSSGRGALWSPTIRCAVTAGTPWMDVYCPGCRTGVAIDIRTIDRHPLASVGSLVLGLRCSLRRKDWDMVATSSPTLKGHGWRRPLKSHASVPSNGLPSKCWTGRMEYAPGQFGPCTASRSLC